jgi:stringent starvation protein B
MAYINQEMKQVIAASLKPVLAKYKVKATLSVQNNLNIKLTLRAGALNIKNDWIVFNREFKGVLTEVTD